MRKMDTKERLKEIASKPTLTATDRNFVRELAALHNVKIERSRCNECIRDAAVIVYRKLVEIEGVQTTSKYNLKKGVDILFMGERINSATITDTNAERWIKAGLPLSYFE